MFSSNASQVSNDANYIEDVFSTWLYTGNGSTQTITNGIDLAGKGGLVWSKGRNNPGYNHTLMSTAYSGMLFSDTTQGANDYPTDINSYNSNGFTLKASTNYANITGTTYASWTFRKQPKFFDVVTYTGNGGTLSVSHALASKPGCIIIKKTSGTGDWLVCTRKSDGNIYAMYLNTTAGQFYDGTEGSLWTSSAVSINWINSNVAGGFNDSGATYVMYVLAHNAGGFGLSGTDNVISCGSYTGNGSSTGPAVNLGYEPQWVMIKNSTDSGPNWAMYDNMRGVATGGTEQRLYANTSGAEVTTSGDDIDLTATGFAIKTNLGYLNTSGSTYIYIAIRRGPMKVPTDGTSVFEPVTRNTTGANATVNAVITPVDLAISQDRNAVDGQGALWFDRLRGATKFLRSAGTDAEITQADTLTSFAVQNGYTLGADAGGYGINSSPPKPVVYWNFRRAPGFFDEVCYTGTGSATTVAHNLNVAPELMIVKSRSLSATNWRVYSDAIGAGNVLFLNSTDASAASSATWNSTAPTASVFSVGTSNNVNGSGSTYVAYLFASAPGVSKVGSYTGTGTTQTINCGFTAGARFVLIKRTDSTGDWYVWDSARGIVAGNDPYLLLNSTAAEVTNTDYIDTTSVGFEITSTAPAAINANGGSFIFFAVS